MISVEKAIHISIENVSPTRATKLVALLDSLDYYLAEDIISPIDMPPFPQSAMDGYAIKRTEGNIYNLLGELKAGDQFQPVLQSGDAYRIFTGSAVPPSADAVIMQELVKEEGTSIYIESIIKEGINIRPQGIQARKNSLVLEAETKMTPAAIGFLTTLGISEILVYTKVTIAVIVTGNELVPAGTKLEYGQIFESNSTMIHTALLKMGFNEINHYKVADSFEQTLESIQTALNENDFIIITGGISVGKYDFVGKALEELKVEKLFYKVKQKPGKPLYFGKQASKLIFALPGNPGAALSCFYVYIQPVLEKLSGSNSSGYSRIKARLLNAHKIKGERSQFLKARTNGSEVEILDGQSSAMLQTFAVANALVYLPANKTIWNVGDYVDTILI